jgi:hypothetical protein
MNTINLTDIEKEFCRDFDNKYKSCIKRSRFAFNYRNTEREYDFPLSYLYGDFNVYFQRDANGSLEKACEIGLCDVYALSIFFYWDNYLKKNEEIQLSEKEIEFCEKFDKEYENLPNTNLNKVGAAWPFSNVNNLTSFQDLFIKMANSSLLTACKMGICNVVYRLQDLDATDEVIKEMRLLFLTL